MVEGAAVVGGVVVGAAVGGTVVVLVMVVGVTVDVVDATVVGATVVVERSARAVVDTLARGDDAAHPPATAAAISTARSTGGRGRICR